MYLKNWKHKDERCDHWIRVTWYKRVCPDGPYKTQRVSNLSKDKAQAMYRYYDRRMSELDIKKVEIGCS
jgi:hypothetical protein